MTSDNKTDGTEVDDSADDEASAAAPVIDSDPEPTEDEAHEVPSEPRDNVLRRMLRGARARIGMILLAAAFIVSAVSASWLYVHQYRPDQQTDSAAARIALQAACNGTIALLSYSPDTVVDDFAAAKTHLTGDFLSYYTKFTEQIVAPAAKQKSVRTTASVVRSAVAEMHPASAVVFVFINQTTTSKDNPVGTFGASAVKVGMKKIDSTWLIASFDPL